MIKVEYNRSYLLNRKRFVGRRIARNCRAAPTLSPDWDWQLSVLAAELMIDIDCLAREFQMQHLRQSTYQYLETARVTAV